MDTTETKTNGSAPLIFNYLNYRIFLRDAFTYKKIKNPRFSMSQFSRKAGFQTHNYISMIISGKRKLSFDKIQVVADLCQLEGSARSYFENLVCWNDEENVAVKEFHWNQLMRSAMGSQIRVFNQMEIELLSRWYTPALIELTTLDDFEPTPDWLQSRFPVDVDHGEVCQTFKKLLALGVLEKIEGKVKQRESVMRTPFEIPSDLIRRHHHCATSNAIKLLEEIEVEFREFTTGTFGLPLSALPEVKKKIQQFQMELLQFASKYESKEEVYQLNMQLFPLSRSEKIKTVTKK